MELEHDPELCPRFHRASELIGSRWTGAIIYVLLKQRCRFATLRDAIPQITDRMLSERLHELEQEGILERYVVPETPVRVEYELTRKGRALATAFDAIAHWAEKWVTVDEATRAGAPRPRRRARQSPTFTRAPGSPRKRSRSAGSA
jgi:DNA-binding HxlR family transcriptional regulator